MPNGCKYIRRLEFNPVLDIKDTAPKWAKLPATDGKHYAFEDFKDKDILVVVFTCNSCPYAVDYEERLVAFSKKYAGSKVGLVAINVNKVEEDLLSSHEATCQRERIYLPISV